MQFITVKKVKLHDNMLNTSRYSNYRSLKIFINQLAALAYLLPEEIIRIFQQLKCIASGKSAEFITSYCKNTCMGISVRESRVAVAPRYLIFW